MYACIYCDPDFSCGRVYMQPEVVQEVLADLKIWAGPSPPLIWTKSKRTAIFFGRPSLIVERANINQSKDVPSRGVWLFTLSPGKQSLLLFSNQPIQLITGQYSGKWLTKTIFEFRGEGIGCSYPWFWSPALLVAGTQKNFFTSLVKVGFSSLLVFHKPRGSSSLSTGGSFLNL